MILEDIHTVIKWTRGIVTGAIFFVLGGFSLIELIGFITVFTTAAVGLGYGFYRLYDFCVFTLSHSFSGPLYELVAYCCNFTFLKMYFIGFYSIFVGVCVFLISFTIGIFFISIVPRLLTNLFTWFKRITGD